MDLEQKAKALSEIEVKTLKVLAQGNKTISVISEKAGIPLDSVRRALAWLSEKELVAVGEGEESLVLNEHGLNAQKKGIPARRLALALKEKGGKAEMKELHGALEKNELSAALGTAKRMNWVMFAQGKMELTGLEKEELEIEKILRKELNELKKEEIVLIEENGFGKVKKTEMSLNTEAKILEDGRRALEFAEGIEKRSYNISGKVPSLNIGKKQPYVRFLEQIRSKLVNMGFNEMETPLIVQEFYNFDVLFQPQNHPARTWTGTYQLKQPKLGTLPNKKSVKVVKDAHEFGANTQSKGWGYKWNEDIAKKLMPAAHGTAHSARQLVKGVESPKKYFSIARCYRPDTVDRTHLIEFNQLEGIIVGEFSFKHLLGMLKEFAEEIAHAKKVKFYPDYYPFTAPSVQLSAKHPELGWVEFGGAGMFRPEMLEPLGIKDQVLAWGLGIDRLAMFKLGIEDIRDLFSQKLDWLRNEKMVVLD